jgi:two-component system OmpR family sensor kinase
MNDLIARLHAQLEFRQQFISDAAHELRTPLTALRLQVNNLRATPDEATRKIAIDEMERGLRRTSEMVTQMLDLARAEAAPTGGDLAPTDLRDAIASALQDVIQLAKEKRIDIGLSTSATTTTATVMADRKEIRTLFKNLLDNAVRYTPAGGSVDIAIERSGERVLLEVSDTGPGIPAAMLDRVFDRFFRVPGNEVDGSGLGLPIVRAVAARCNASVTLHNRPGHGGLVASVLFREAGELGPAYPSKRETASASRTELFLPASNTPMSVGTSSR